MFRPTAGMAKGQLATPIRVTTAFNRLLNLPGVILTDVAFQPGTVVVTVRGRQARLHCPDCAVSTGSRYDRRSVASLWRHLDLGAWRLEVRATLRRLRCPVHGVRTEAVPFARRGSRFTSDFEDLVGWLATTMDATALCRLVRPELTLVSNHATGRFVWGKQGKDAATLDSFFTELGEQRSAAITAVSMDMGPAYDSSVRKEAQAVQAVSRYDSLRVAPLARTAVDKARRAVWHAARRFDSM